MIPMKTESMDNPTNRGKIER